MERPKTSTTGKLDNDKASSHGFVRGGSVRGLLFSSVCLIGNWKSPQNLGRGPSFPVPGWGYEGDYDRDLNLASSQYLHRRSHFWIKSMESQWCEVNPRML